MKNFTKLIIVVFLTGLAMEAGAQHFGYQYTGYSGYPVNTGYSWRSDHYFPHRIKRVVRSYHGFEWTGTKQFHRGYRHFYVVTLQRKNRVIELTFNRFGEVIRQNRYILRYEYHPIAYRRGYGNKKVVYHHDGYVYNHFGDRFDYDWEAKKDKDDRKWEDRDFDRNGKEKERSYRNRGW